MPLAVTPVDRAALPLDLLKLVVDCSFEAPGVFDDGPTRLAQLRAQRRTLFVLRQISAGVQALTDRYADQVVLVDGYLELARAAITFQSQPDRAARVRTIALDGRTLDAAIELPAEAGPGVIGALAAIAGGLYYPIGSAILALSQVGFSPADAATVLKFDPPNRRTNILRYSFVELTRACTNLTELVFDFVDEHTADILRGDGLPLPASCTTVRSGALSLSSMCLPQSQHIVNRLFPSRPRPAQPTRYVEPKPIARSIGLGLRSLALGPVHGCPLAILQHAAPTCASNPPIYTSDDLGAACPAYPLPLLLVRAR